MKIVNKRAYHDYEILDKIEAGVVLTGAEAKSVRAGRAQLGGAYVKVMENEIYVINLTIPEYVYAREKDYQPDRTRKLLLKYKEILAISHRCVSKGVTLVPLSLYTRKGLVKVEIGIVKGKKTYEKRETIKRKDMAREAEKELRVKII